MEDHLRRWQVIMGGAWRPAWQKLCVVQEGLARGGASKVLIMQFFAAKIILSAKSPSRG